MLLWFEDLSLTLLYFQLLPLPFVKRKQSLLVHLPLNSRSIPCRRHSASSPCCSSVSCPLIVCLGTRRSLMQSQKFWFCYCEHPPAHVSTYLAATVVLTGKQHWWRCWHSVMVAQGTGIWQILWSGAEQWGLQHIGQEPYVNKQYKKLGRRT